MSIRVRLVAALSVVFAFGLLVLLVELVWPHGSGLAGEPAAPWTVGVAALFWSVLFALACRWTMSDPSLLTRAASGRRERLRVSADAASGSSPRRDRQWPLHGLGAASLVGDGAPREQSWSG